MAISISTSPLSKLEMDTSKDFTWDNETHVLTNVRRTTVSGLPWLVCGIILGCALSSMVKTGQSLQDARVLHDQSKVPVAAASSCQEYDNGCGHTWQEAKSLGCKYDVLASRWYTPSCHHGDVLEEMLSEVAYIRWYEDPQHTNETSWAAARAGEFTELWPTPNFHIVHCLYLWRRLHAAVLQRRSLDEDVLDYGHTLHCTRMIMSWPENLEIERVGPTSSPTKFPLCKTGPLQGYI